MSYEEEGKLLMEECIHRREKIIKKYEKKDAEHIGMDGMPSSKPLAEVSLWFQSELDKLREKYLLPTKDRKAKD